MSKPRNARELKAFLTGDSDKLDPAKVEKFNDLCEAGKLGLSNFSVQDLAHTFSPAGAWQRDEARVQLRESKNLLEAGGLTVNSTVFPQITGQLLFSEIRQQHDVEANVFTPLVRTVPSIIKGTEIVPSITMVDPSDIENIAEGQAYPRIGVVEEYHTLAAKQKKGAIIEVTKEAIKYDKTGLLVGQAQSLGRALGAARENETIDALIGITNNYSRNGTAANTYLTATTINNQATVPLSDWTDLQGAMLLFDDMLDPNTSEPIMHQIEDLIVCNALKMTALRILTATGTRKDSDAAEPLNETTLGHNPVAGKGWRLLTSNRLRRRIIDGGQTAAVADGTYFLGSLARLLAYYEVFPLALLQKGAESEASWDRDVSLQFKASYLGVTQVREPRGMVRSEDTVWA